MNYVLLSTKVASAACRSPDMATMSISTEQCEYLNGVWTALGLQWPDLLERYSAMGGGMALEGLASEWRDQVGRLTTTYGGPPFRFHSE